MIKAIALMFVQLHLSIRISFVFFLGENQEQLKINFTRMENIQRLTCRTRNTIGPSESTVNVDVLCK